MKKRVKKKSITLESFFKKNFKKEFFPKCDNSFELFCNYLKKNKILNARKKDICPSLKTINNGYMTEARSVVVSTKEKCFKNYICEVLKKDKLYTWQQLHEKTKIKIEYLESAMTRLNIWNDKTNEFRCVARYNEVSKYGLFSEKTIDAIINRSSDLKDVKYSFLIQWVGPFSSLNDCSKWEKDNSCRDCEYNFYYAKGKRYKEKKPSFYIGKSEMKDVCDRMKQSTDPVAKFRKNDSLEIWIGRFSKPEHRSNHNLVEIAEWAIIYSFEKRNPKLKSRLINEKKRKEPKDFCCVVNQCFDKKSLEMREKRSNAMTYIPSMVFYYGADNIRINDSSKMI